MSLGQESQEFVSLQSSKQLGAKRGPGALEEEQRSQTLDHLFGRPSYIYGTGRIKLKIST